MSWIEKEIQEKLVEMEELMYEIQGTNIECQRLARTADLLQKQNDMLKEKLRQQAIKFPYLAQEIDSDEESDDESCSVSATPEETSAPEKEFSHDQGMPPFEGNKPSSSRSHYICNDATLSTQEKLVDASNAPGGSVLSLRPSGSQRKCHHCKRQFKNFVAFVIHMSLHDNKRPFYCKRCMTEFAGLQSFKAHLNGHSKQELQTLI